MTVCLVIALGCVSLHGQELQPDLLSRVPGAEQLVAGRNGRAVPRDQPEAIVEAIGRVVEVIKRNVL